MSDRSTSRRAHATAADALGGRKEASIGDSIEPDETAPMRATGRLSELKGSKDASIPAPRWTLLMLFELLPEVRGLLPPPVLDDLAAVAREELAERENL